MIAVLALIFLALIFVAAGFAAWPLLRTTQAMGGRIVLALAIAVFVLAIGGGVYALTGAPVLALRTLEGPQKNLPSLVAVLAKRVVRTPDDPRGWVLLGRGYLSLNAPDEAAKAFARALALEDAAHVTDAELLSSYGEALVQANAGAVPEQAENVFRRVLAADPHDSAARYYMGMALAMHGKTEQALAIWQSLLNDSPPDAPWRDALIDHMAALKARSGAPPNVAAMVAGLAARLKTQPGDVDGWQRLVRAYSVLRQMDKAKAALAGARSALKNNPAALKALSLEAKNDRLE